MSEELKTLKDFMNFSRIKDNGRATLLVDMFDLNQEAIKNIKERVRCPCETCQWQEKMIDKWIINFFNLSEEELK